MITAACGGLWLHTKLGKPPRRENQECRASAKGFASRARRIRYAFSRCHIHQRFSAATPQIRRLSESGRVALHPPKRSPLTDLLSNEINPPAVRRRIPPGAARRDPPARRSKN